MAAVRTNSVQSGLATTIEAALMRELTQYNGLGEGSVVQVEVLSASESVLATDAQSQIHQAQLVVRVLTAGPAPREIVLQGRRSYAVSAQSPLEASVSRQKAYDGLVDELMHDATVWLLFQGGD